MLVIDLLLDDLAKEIKDALGWLTLIIVCNLLLAWQVVLEAIESRGFHVRDEKALIATLAAIVLFLLGDIFDILVFPRREDAERWEKVLRDIMLAVLICGVFYVVGKEWTRRLWVLGILLLLGLIHSLRGNFRDNKDKQKQEELKEVRNEASYDAEKKQGWLKHFESRSLMEERKRAGDNLKLKEDEYSVSKSLALAQKQYNWRLVYFQNEAGKFLRSLVFPAMLMGVVLFSRQQWVDGVFAIAAALGFLACYFWLKQLHMISLYKRAQHTSREQNCFATTLDNGRRVFFWNDDLAGCGRAANCAGTLIDSTPQCPDEKTHSQRN
jgi:hypothetical protein